MELTAPPRKAHKRKLREKKDTREYYHHCY
jgi:hypothetical protein